MKKLSFNTKALGKLLIVPALAIIAITIDSCKKESGVGTATPAATVNSTSVNKSSSKSAKLNSSISKALRDFIVAGGATNLQSGFGSGSNNYSNTATNFNVYSTPAANVYSWSDPTTHTTFSLAESTGSGSGGGLGQLAYNGKSFDYNYVLCITSKDPAWCGFLNGRDLRGVVAIDGKIMDEDFSIKNLAIFLVEAKTGDGKYDFIDFNSTSFGSGDAVGELLDFSEVDNNTLANMDKAKYFVTSNGSIEVTTTSFTMSSNAKVTDLVTQAEYSIDGSISCE